MSRDEDKKKKKEKEPPPEDLSTPDIRDETFVQWAARCFRGDEQATEFVVHQLLRPNMEGELVRSRPVAHLKGEDGGVDLEKLAVVCNELHEEMEDEANNLRRSRSFVVRAKNSKKGGTFALKTITVEPRRGLVLRNGSAGLRRGDIEDEDFDPLGGDILRKRAQTVLEDGRYYAEHVTKSLGGIIEILSRQLAGKDEQINKLFASNMEYANRLNEAENNKLDRDLIRAERELILGAKRRGISLLAGFLPDFLKKVSVGAVEVPGGRTAESLAIEAIMDEQAGGLTAEEKHKIFGDWTDAGERLMPGILSEAQVRIFVGVLNDKVSPDALDRLITDGSDDQLTTVQYSQILAALGGDLDKLTPVLKILKDRRSVIDKRVKAPSPPGVTGETASPLAPSTET